MPLYSIALINPHGKVTGIGKATLQMKAKDRDHARYAALAYARESYNWSYHFKDGIRPQDKAGSAAELNALREDLGLPAKEHKLADLPEMAKV